MKNLISFLFKKSDPREQGTENIYVYILKKRVTTTNGK